MERTCLIVDNENQEYSIEKIIRSCKTKGVTVKVEQFKVGNTEFTEVLDESGRIDMNKVIDYYRTHYRKLHFDFIAFDWDLNDEAIDGIELIRQFKASSFLRKIPVALYSGELPDTVRGYFEGYRKNIKTFKESWTKIRTLIDVPIQGFYDRANYEDKIADVLQSLNNNFDVDLLLLKKLKEHSDLVFNNINPRFEGKTFGAIADIIENDPRNGDGFISELIEQMLAYLLKVNPQISL